MRVLGEPVPEPHEPQAVPLQDRYAPNSDCFGCGPANSQGLRVKSRVEGDRVVADWIPAPHHKAFDGYVSGGILGVLFDCHSNWAAVHFLMLARGLTKPPDTVTAQYAVSFLKPTPMGRSLHFASTLVEIQGNRATVETTLDVDGTVTATATGTFVIVKKGHPAYGRWH